MSTWDLVGDSDYDGDEIGRSDLVAAIDILGAALSKGKGRRSGRVEHRIERRGGKGKDTSRLEGRLSHLLGKPNSYVQVAQQTPEVLRDYEMPLGRILMDVGAPGTLRETAQRTIRLERLILSSVSLAGIDVTSINIGVEQQKAAIANSPAEAYAFNAVASSLRGNTLNPGMSASIGLINNNLAEASCAGMFRGEALQF
jgi:hypothetical protein